MTDSLIQWSRRPVRFGLLVRQTLLLLMVAAFVTACSHPLEIVGEGDILSASGDRTCLLEEYQAGAENCTENLVVGAYSETYYAQPRTGWKFQQWENYCKQDPGNECHFEINEDVVVKSWGETLPPLRAVFVQDDIAECETVFDKNDVFIVDLSPDSESPDACMLLTEDDDIADCIAEDIKIRFAETPECLGAFDVFVPGTNQEDGNYQQFTSIISPTPGRTYLSVQYSYDPNSLDDGAKYDKGVVDASTALNKLLYTLQDRFEVSDIRVFGHSKGSDPVARASLDLDNQDVQFFAFAQAGRTPSNILGSPGYVEKLTENLVVLTWQNDEVSYYSGGSDGFQTPEVWGFPGFVNQAGGGQSISPIRLDHHNNYGGTYTKEDLPYCAAGNKLAYTLANECKKQSGVDYLPYFWGDSVCTSMTYDLMNTASVPSRFYIGNSGPRGSNCKEMGGTVSATVDLTVSIDLGDQDDCKYIMEIAFLGSEVGGVNRPDGGTLTISRSKDLFGARLQGETRLPLHMVLNVKASMEDVSGTFSKCDGFLGADSEGYIHKLSVGFTHPGTGKKVTRTLIGNGEGAEYIYPLKLADKNNVAWKKRSGSWDMHYGAPVLFPSDALMIKGETEGGIGGEFYKPLWLID